ncbi:MAG: signal peptide peptidase SppA [Kofleriaceae bacterium]|nr:signal peptide peptidase SppA [Myxococcales bacterium]MCB9563087.1 signal peptide peptidase SppA [Kofleriaceae bacterium]
MTNVRAFLAVAVLAAAVAACKGSSDSNGSKGGSGSAAGSDDDDGSGGGGGFGGLGGLGADPMQLLKQIGDSLGQPGPFEAPDSSPGYAADAAHWAVVELSGKLVELEGYDFGAGSLIGGRGPSGVELRTLTTRLRALGQDPNVSGLLLRVDGLAGSLPDVMELRAALADVRAAGKKVACHTEAASNAEYLVLAACDTVGVAPLGEIVITGPAAMPIHLKGLLDDLGVTADFLHVGAYKGAAEPLTRDAPSAEMRETLDGILDRAYATMVDTIATSRGLAPDKVKALIDEAMFPAEHALAAGLVDQVAPFEAFRDAVVGDAPWHREPVEAKDAPMAAAFKVMRFLGAMPAGRTHGPHVALVYAVGNVVDGGGDGTIGARQEIASHTMVAALRTLAADDDVKAVVLRIDSGGGSALASELIWQEVSAMAGKKPVVVSMSDVAASGGYYIACGATKIFAMPDTLTGSIGVVGGKLAPGGALAKIGIKTYPMGRGKRATMMASMNPWTADERAAVQTSMEEVYGTFVARVAAGRKLDLEAVKKIAQGRVWTGETAKQLGLIDELGGLDAALAEAEKLGGVAPGGVVEAYPSAPTLRDFVASFGGVSMPWGLDGAVVRIAREISPAAAEVTERTLQQLLLIGQARVATVALWPVVMP